MISIEYMIYHMKVHIVSYNLDQKKFSKSKIHILPNYEQTNLKMAIVSDCICSNIEHLSNIDEIRTIRIQIGKNDWDLETYRKIYKNEYIL